jgi:hypothetical protein
MEAVRRAQRDCHRRQRHHLCDKEKRFGERLVEIVNELQATGANTYRPAFGSAEYWEAVEMAKRGWLLKTDFGFMRPTTFHWDSLYSGRRRY